MISALTCHDWRDVSFERLSPLYRGEIARWTSVLDWDSAAGMQEVERGRTLGHVRGFVVTDAAGAVEGWCYYLLSERTLQIGGFVTRSLECSEMMLQRIFSDEGVDEVETVTFFAFSDAPGLARSLRQRGLLVDRYWYFKTDLAEFVPQFAPGARRWRSEDRAAAVQLLKRAYPAGDQSRPFAPRGTTEEWTEYLQQLMEADGCGQLLADACISVPLGPDRLSGLALVSRISSHTAHLVQLAVDPGAQRQGIGSAMLLAACGTARRLGYGRMTMMVSGKNSRARAMYQGAGFVAVASFVAGGSLQPLRLTSVASGGVAATRR